tara:strand:- start:1727 stop:2119 length:393 start_codon:yes stop_codon:yes gene_type:complete
MGKFNTTIACADGIKLNNIWNDHYEIIEEVLLDVSFTKQCENYLTIKNLKQIGYEGSEIIFVYPHLNFEKVYKTKNFKFNVGEVLEIILDFQNELNLKFFNMCSSNDVYFEGFNPKEESESNKFEIIWGK